MLLEIKRYLEVNRRASLAGLATRFDVDPRAMQSMLDRWVRKGRVRLLPAGATGCGCAGCSGCSAGGGGCGSSETTAIGDVPLGAIYEWRDAA